MIHRDLKPGNIFLARFDDDEVVKLLDFGVAKLRYNDELAPGVQMTQTGVIFGSPSYMSPEQARGNRVIDHRTDLWSLAVILFRAITGVKPFEAGSIGDLVIKLCIDRCRCRRRSRRICRRRWTCSSRGPSRAIRMSASRPRRRWRWSSRDRSPRRGAVAMPFIPAPPPAARADVFFREPLPSFREPPPGPSPSMATFTPLPDPRGSAPRYEAPPPSSPTPSRSLRIASTAAPMPSNVLGVLGTFSGSYAQPPSPPSRPDLREVPPAPQSHPFGAATGGYGRRPPSPRRSLRR